MHFNSTAYNNEELTNQWIDNDLIPSLKPTAYNKVLLALDAASFYITSEIPQKLRYNHIIPAVNKPFNELLQEYTELYIDARKEAGDNIEK